jgi:hypothetical protein
MNLKEDGWLITFILVVILFVGLCIYGNYSHHKNMCNKYYSNIPIGECLWMPKVLTNTGEIK